VRAAREAAGLSQEAFAERARMHRTFVGHVERGETNPTLETIVLLAGAVGIDPGELLYNIDDPSG
jgi:transcriptional regulator with XRE-family HTH domain